MITLKPGTAYAPSSIGMDYEHFCDLEPELPVTGTETVDVEMTGGGSAELAAFRFQGMGTVFLADRANVTGLTIEFPQSEGGGDGEGGNEIIFAVEAKASATSGTIAVVGTLETAGEVKVTSMTWDNSPGASPPPTPIGAKYQVLVFDTEWHPLCDFISPGTFPAQIPLSAPDTVFTNEAEPLQIGLSSDVEPSNAGANPKMEVTIVFETV